MRWTRLTEGTREVLALDLHLGEGANSQGHARRAALKCTEKRKVQQGSSIPARLQQAHHGALAVKVLSDCLLPLV